MSPKIQNGFAGPRSSVIAGRQHLRAGARLAFALLALAATPASFADITLEWDANTEPDLAGYKLHYGTGSLAYTTIINVGKVTQTTVPLPGAGTYFFAVTAYNLSAVESAYSNEVSFTFVSQNRTPVADSRIVITAEDAAILINVTASDPDGNPLSFIVPDLPAHGDIFGTPPLLVYYPDPDFHGSDSFTFVASDGRLTSPKATVSINVIAVNDPPSADARTVTTMEDTPAAILLSGADIDGDLLTFSISSGPRHGKLSGTAPHIIYSPDLNFYGSDSFLYRASDGTAASADASIEIEVAPVNDPPVAADDFLTTTTETAIPVVLAANDPDGESLTFSIVSSPSSGVLSGAAPGFVYTPEAGFVGETSVTFNASDGRSVSGPATIRIRVVRPGVWEVVALSGEPAPGTNGARYSSFQPAVRSNSDGNAAFRGTLDSPPGSESGVWLELDGVSSLIARRGQPAPGVDFGIFDAFPVSPWWSGSGHLLLLAQLQTGLGTVTLSDDTGLWYKAPSGPLQLMARKGGPAPGTAGKFAMFGTASLADHGKFAFTASLATNYPGITSANDSGIWANSGGLLTALLREGDVAPGSAYGENFDSLVSAGISMNSWGQVAFGAALRPVQGVASASKSGIWMWDGVQITKVLRSGDFAPGLPQGVVFGSAGSPLLRTSTLVFRAGLAGNGVDSSNDTSLWVKENGSLSLLARTGSPAQGTTASFGSLPAAVAGNDDGAVVFTAGLRVAGEVTTSNDTGIWVRSPPAGSGLRLVAREGSRAPQTPAGAVFASFDSPIISGGGREIFTALLRAGTGGVTTANDQGLWIRGHDGALLLLLREGDAVPFSINDVRSVSGINLDSASEFGAASFGADNSFKVIVTFAGGSQAVLSCAVP